MIPTALKESEVLWLRAANTLKPYERTCALTEIAEMSGLPISAIRRYADMLRKPGEEVYVDTMYVVRKAPAPPPSSLAPPDRNRLMGRR